LGKIVRIVCLANSRRPGGRCVAGKEIKNGLIGGWIRPVSPRKGDGLSIVQVITTGGTEAAHLDIIDVPVVGEARSQFQTENLAIDPGKKWERVGRFPRGRIQELQDTPEALWLNGDSSGAGENDRVEESVAAAALETSLHLIRPNTLQVSRDEGFEKPQVRADFIYHDIAYRLVVTDLAVEASLAAKGMGPWEIDPKRVLLCISLALPFKGHAYKLVAGIIGFTGV